MRIALLMFLGLLVGCGQAQPKGTSYNEALQTYEAELRLYERLDKETGELVTAEAKAAFSRNDKALAKGLEGVPEEEVNAWLERDKKDFEAIHSPKLAKVRADKDAQKIRVDAAKKVVDELRQSK